MSEVEIKKLLGTEKLIIGTEETLKLLKQGSMEKIFLASNSAENVVKDMEHYAKLSGATVEMLKVPNEEVGILCKKPFSVSVLGKKK